MSYRLAEIHVLAHEIEWTHARERARLKGRFKGIRGPDAVKKRNAEVHAEFDPLAATCLADLIAHRLFGRGILDDAADRPTHDSHDKGNDVG